MLANATFDAWMDRNGARFDAACPITLVKDGAEIGSAVIRNVSAYGFMADGKAPVDIGEVVSVDLLAGDRLDVRIVWALCGRIGAEFLPPIEAPLVERIATQSEGGV